MVPCYRYGHFLPDAVASALDQEGVDVDVLIVDDASPDDSAAVAHALADRDPRVRVLVHEENAGHIRTYNDGLAEVDGDYVVLLSADDRLPRNALTRAVSLMEHHPSVGLVYGFPQSFTDEPPSQSERVRSWSVWPGHDWLAHLSRRGGNVIMSPEVVLRREAWTELGGYDPRLPHSADLAAWLHTSLRWDVGRVNGPAAGLLPRARRQHAPHRVRRHGDRPATAAAHLRPALRRGRPAPGRRRRPAGRRAPGGGTHRRPARTST